MPTSASTRASGYAGRIVHRYGARLLVDAAQLVAHRKIEMGNCGIDYFAFSAHKVYAPFGTGVLVVRKGLLNFSTADLNLIRASGEETGEVSLPWARRWCCCSGSGWT